MWRKFTKKKKINQAKYEKIKLMLSKKIEYPGICWPVDIIYNEDQTFVGFLMPKASGKKLQRCLFVKPLLLKTFPHWKKRDTVELCITILDKIQYLHDRNVILGDINPMNILIVSPTEVYLVDTDSYQIEGFPCPVGTIIFTAPEIQGKNYTSFLRTFGNEYFAIATLLFMMMLPGKPPYSQQGGESLAENIINMDFSYPLGEQSNKKTPEGPWRYIWSHLPYYLKEAFYKTFRKGEEYSTEERRLPPWDWRDKFSHYLELLDSGKYAQQDELSLELFPNRFKKIGGMSYIHCKLCHKEIMEGMDQNGICRECLMKGEVYRCSRCGKELIYTNFAKYVKQTKRHEICPECYTYLNETHSRMTCVDCGQIFTLTIGEYEHYTSKGLVLPKRCADCRRRRQNDHNSRIYNSKSSKGCYITTAVCEYLGKADDCYELTMFRRFRDHWLAHQPDGRKLIEEYYATAPSMVTSLAGLPNRDQIYRWLWDQYLSRCLIYLENSRFEECRQLYEEMVSRLKSVITH